MQQRVQSGIPGLDEVINGGLPGRTAYLVVGQPGTGKTTIGLHFLIEGARRGEKSLYICLAETRGQLDDIAKAYGWSLDGIQVHELRQRNGSDSGKERAGYTVFSPSEVELEEISEEFRVLLERVQPSRLVLDSLSEIRLIAQDPARYRRQLLAMTDLITRCGCTAVLLDVESEPGQSDVAQTLVSGVIHLEQLAPAYGGARRRLTVRKLRASKSVGGYHDFTIGDHGLQIYPRLVAATHRSAHVSAAMPSGIAELDALLGGGLDAGTSTVLMGPAGSGKTSLASQFVAAAGGRGVRAALFCFDESPTNLLVRSRGLGIPLEEHVNAGKVHIAPIDPAEFSPGELSYRVRMRVDDGARIVVLDSINGYMNALPEERFLSAHLHELLAFLSEKGVVTILTLAYHGLGASEAPVSISYIADTVVLFRYLEEGSEVRQAISIVKKRTGSHERTIREIKFGPDGLRIGNPLAGFQGVLSDRLRIDLKEPL